MTVRAPRPLLARLRPAPPSRDTALALTEALGAVAHAMSGAEYLADRANRAPGGLNDWDVVRAGSAGLPVATRAVLDTIGRRPVTDAVHAGRVLAAVALLVPHRRRAVRVAANAYLAGSQTVMYPLTHYGADGSDHASLLVQTAAAVARAGERRPAVVDACLWFVAAQAGLSYGVSGVTKVFGPAWRDGSALPGILRTTSNGDLHMWRLVTRYPRIAHVLGHGVVGVEAAFPLALVGPTRRLAPLFVAWAAAFHAVNARVMGLNRFLPAFVATHPAVLYVAAPRRRLVRGAVTGRDDSALWVGAGVGAALLAAAALSGRGRRRRIEVGSPGERSFATSHGNVLRFRRFEHGRVTAAGAELAWDATAPLIVCESGLASTGEHWERVAGPLSEQAPVITYHRAGMGNSLLGRGPWDLDVAVDDLLELAGAQAGGRPVVLVGHSLGGYLVWRAASRDSAAPAAVVLLDPSHPEETTGPQGRAAGKAITAAIGSRRRSQRMGLGVLVEDPTWMRLLPATVSGLIADQMRDRRLWTAADREWRAASEAFAGAAPAAPPVPTLVLTASRTADDAPERVSLHRAASEGHPHGRHDIVGRSNHESLLYSRRVAPRVVGTIREFLDEIGTSFSRPHPEVFRVPHAG